MFKHQCCNLYLMMPNTGWHRKTCRTFACIVQCGSWNKSARKHICSGQTYL